jgi:N-acetylmuramoyl-L-alanine amidase
MSITPVIRLLSAFLLAILVAAGGGSAVGGRAWAAGEAKSNEAKNEARNSEARGAAVIAAAVAVEVEGGKTRFRVSLSGPVAAQAYLMENPDRVIVDLPEVSFHLPDDTGRRKEGLLASYRYGLFAPGRSRVVMDLAHPAVVSAIHVETNLPGGAALLTVELSRTDRDGFRRAAAASAALASRGEAGPAVPGENKDARPVIMIDPGHGGIDPGALASASVVEKDLVLSFAHLLRKKLEAEGRYRVLMTRERDVFVSLGDRVRAARAARADLFISIHADSISGGQDVRGLTVYTGSERASDADSARLADRENKADAAAGVEAADGADQVLDILQELTLRETRTFSHNFALRLVGELDPVARLNKNPRREAGFKVLRAHDVPSVLLELGYLSSRQDLDLLMSDQWRGKMVSAMAVAVDRFFATRLARGGAAAVLP